MPLKLRYTAETNVPVEVEGLTPDFARDKSVSELERFEILHGNRKTPLAEMFKVTGDASDGRLNFEGNLAGVHWIGAKMTNGHIHIDGPAGRHVGSEMSGGHIHTHGDVGDHAGAEMRGGHLHIGGSAGNRVGAAYPGSRRGMTGGSLLIAGNAGDEIGHLMRRGLIAIGGTSGDHVGFNMLAGSIVLFGRTGVRPGAGMKRGTIALLGDANPTLLPTFRRACRLQPMAFRVVLRSLRNHHFEIPDELLAAQFDLYNGDFLSGGRGEILVRASAPTGR